MEDQVQVLRQIKNILWIALLIFATEGFFSIFTYVKGFDLIDLNRKYYQQNIKNDLELFRGKIRDYIDSSEFSDALKYLNEVEKTYSSNPYFYFYRAKAYLGIRDFNKAIENLEKVNSMAPDWKSEWTDPLMKKAQEGLSNKH